MVHRVRNTPRVNKRKPRRHTKRRDPMSIDWRTVEKALVKVIRTWYETELQQDSNTGDTHVRLIEAPTGFNLTEFAKELSEELP